MLPVSKGVARSAWSCAGALALVLVSLATTACGGTPAHTRDAGGPLLLYSGQHPQTTQSLIGAFEKATGTKVQVRYDDEAFLASEIVQEASHPRADVLLTENSPALEYVQEKGLLERLPARILSETPAKYNSPSGDWIGVSARVSVLVYDPKLVSRAALPEHILQLALPRYKGELALAPGETDFQPVVTSVYLQYGRARALSWLRALAANSAGHTYADNEAVTGAVNRGAAAFGLIDQYYWYRLRSELGASNMPSRIAYFVPHDAGYVVDVSGAGVLASSSHKPAAEKFIAFLVSKQGQEIIAKSDSFEYPLDHGLKPAAAETPFAQLQPHAVSITQLGDGSVARSLLREAGFP